jgi:hypothetical protein
MHELGRLIVSLLDRGELGPIDVLDAAGEVDGHHLALCQLLGGNHECGAPQALIHLFAQPLVEVESPRKR